MLGAGIPPVDPATGPPSEGGLVLFAVIVGFLVIVAVWLAWRSRDATASRPDFGQGLERSFDRVA